MDDERWARDDELGARDEERALGKTSGTLERNDRIRYAIGFSLFWMPEFGDRTIGEMRGIINYMTQYVAIAIDDPTSPKAKEQP